MKQHESPILYGWPVSPYSVKAKSYLDFAGVEYRDRQPTILQLQRRIRANVGRIVMPTMELEGVWVQDSSDIISHFESKAPCVTPERELLGFFSSLLEVFGDEWLIIAAMQTRWCMPGNPEFVISEFARLGAPRLPRVLGIRLAARLAVKMQDHLPRLGLTTSMGEAFDAMLDTWLEDLNAHLSTHDYLLGGRPCVGDFACMGPIYAHVWRDPSSRSRVETWSHVVRWMHRVQSGAVASGAWFEDVPTTLDAVLKPAFEQLLPWGATVVDAINQWCGDNPGADRVPRSLGWAEFIVGDVRASRKIATFSQWKVQPVIAYGASPEVLQWRDERPLSTVLDTISIRHPMKREGFREWLINPA